MPKRLWGGRFKKDMDPLLQCFSYSLAVDHELFYAELKVNRAWARMLARAKLVTAGEGRRLVRGIDQLARQFRKRIDPHDAAGFWGPYGRRYEDVHSLIQAELEKKVGPAARKLHTGRSRNDLVVTSTRLYLREKAVDIEASLIAAQCSLVGLAKRAGESIVAGMTHLRMAQPVLLAHLLLAYVEMLEEDKGRLRDAVKRADVLALGSGALAGSSLPIDQRFLARQLGFSKVAGNSVAAVSDRAFLTEYVSALAILWMHLSRMAEDFILWNSEAFHYVELDDAFATGSSLMPQKKNPDVFELIRGRAGVILGHLVSLLTLQKGLPLAYNRDLQEDKPGFFDAVRKTGIALELVARTVDSLSLHPESMDLSLHEDGLFATDLLEYLVRKGVAFTEAHEAVGRLIRRAADREKPVRELPLGEWKRFSPEFERDVFDLFDPRVSVSSKRTVGSTRPAKVKAEILRWERALRSRGR